MPICKNKVTGHIPLMRCHLSLRNGLYKNSCTYGSKGEYSNCGGFIASNMSIISPKSINGIRISCNTNFPVAAKPTIKIYGIRA